MTGLDPDADPAELPVIEAARIGRLLGLGEAATRDDLALAEAVASGLQPTAAEALAAIIGRSNVVGPIVPEASLRRARRAGKPLSRELGQRLYDIARVVDAACRLYHGDREAMRRFLERPHPLLDGRSALTLAQSSSAGADAVMRMLERAEASVAA